MGLSPEVKAVISAINKKHGADSIVIASDIKRPPAFTTGSLSVDAILAGGFPANQWTEVIGKESAGKTSFVHKAVAANQRANPDFSTFWLGAEGYEPEWASQLGVDVSRVVSYPTCSMEEAYDAMLMAAESKTFDCIVLDSYPALVADAEAKKEMEEVSVALGARYTGKFFRKAGKACHRSPTGEDRPFCGIFINQYRADIGGFSPHGTPQTTPGGAAKNYAFYARLQIAKKEELTDNVEGGMKRRVGHVMSFKTIKSKVSPPGQVASVDFYVENTDSGFKAGDYDVAKELMGLGIYHKVIDRTGSFFSYGGQRWHGKDALLAAVRESDALCKAISEDILTAAVLRQSRG